MIRKLIILVAGLVMISSSAWAYRVIDLPENAYELSLGVVTLPDSDRGSVIFTLCDDCRTMALGVTNETRYFVNRTPMSRDELREVASRRRATSAGRADTGVVVFYDTASLRVNRVVLVY